MTETNYTTSMRVAASPQQVFDAITNPRSWWSEEIAGPTDRVGEAFDYHFRDIHRCRIAVTEMVPGRKVSWHVLENAFNFISDQSEWVGSDIVFDITPRDDGAELTFTHVGLVPAHECYAVCEQAWTHYIHESLKGLIETGRGNPNKAEKDVSGSYTTRFEVARPAAVVFEAINDVRSWWEGEIEGESSRQGNAFTYRYPKMHRSTQRVTELVPGKRVVWHVEDAELTFIADRGEWTGTDIVFDIAESDGKTIVTFTHQGLLPEVECYDMCSDAWGGYINGSLKARIERGA